MSAKVFKSLDEQVDILKSKGLVITDYDKTNHKLTVVIGLQNLF